MRFRVLRLRHRGRPLPRHEWQARAPVVGDLRVEQLYDDDLLRHLRLARLVDVARSVGPDAVPALYDPRGRYGRWNVAALASYAIGILAQVPFLAQKLYTGPLTEALGGADISWMVGLVVTAAVYYPWARATANPPAQMVYSRADAEPASDELGV